MRTEFVAILGRANVGKSTLINALVGEKIAIVSNKPQTTRNRIIGIYNEPDLQIVFIDTPGLHVPKNKLGEHMMSETNEAMDGIDAAVGVVDCKPPRSTEANLLRRLNGAGVPVILVVNKIDLVRKDEIARTLAAYADLATYAAVVPISALRQDGVKIVLDELRAFAGEEGVQYYPDDIATNQTVRQMASEIVREKILRHTYDEVPHGVAVEPIVFRERENRNGEPVTDIAVNIICERDAHKGMLIGKGGSLLKTMATEARKDLEDLLGTKVNLQCFVKVRENWRDNEKIITELHLYDE